MVKWILRPQIEKLLRMGIMAKTALQTGRIPSMLLILLWVSFDFQV